MNARTLTFMLVLYVVMIIIAQSALPGTGKLFIGVLLLIGVAMWLVAMRERKVSS